MSQPTQSLIFYVRQPAGSAAFYSQLLGRAPVDASPNFVMFALGERLILNPAVTPLPAAPGAASVAR